MPVGIIRRRAQLPRPAECARFERDSVGRCTRCFGPAGAEREAAWEELEEALGRFEMLVVTGTR